MSSSLQCLLCLYKAYLLDEASQLFRDMTDIAREKDSGPQTKLVGLFVECRVVELVQKIWKKCEDKKLLEQNTSLPPHVDTSLTVIFLVFFYSFIALCYAFVFNVAYTFYVEK